jgi:hypothetical protein
MDLTRTESTRYLCAAAHLDGKFRHWLHEHVIEDQHHAIGRPAGVDLATVVRHCLAAERRQFYNELIYAVLLLVSVYVLLATPELRSLVGLSARVAAPHPTGAALVLTVVALVGLSWFVLMRDLWDVKFRVLARDLARSSFKPDATGIKLPRDLEERLASASDDPANNVVIYSGYAPFVGSGVNVGGWSFAVNISKPKDNLTGLLRTLGADVASAAQVTDFPASTLGFALEDLYASISGAIARLDLPGVSMRDQLYVNGKTIRDDRRFLDDVFAPPRTRVDGALMREFVGALAQPIRHYKVVEASTWNGELVLSIFLRFGKIDQSLFMETSYHLLTPVHVGYRVVDAIPRHPSSRQWMPLVIGALIGGPLLTMVVPFLLLGRALERYGRWLRRKEVRRTIEDDPQFDYGAATTVREFARSQGYHQYFQQLDKEMYLKIIERQVLDTAVDFLDRHDIDTSDLRQRQTTILNNGVVAGSVSADSVAVGAFSTAKTSMQSGAPSKAA